MSEPKFIFELPEKTSGGILVRLWFKTYNDALDWMREQGLIGPNSAKTVVDAWEDHAHKQVDREAKGIRKKIQRWLSGNR